ncbi:hypothetical protein L3Q82_025135 [Scortum barcoo]|uniref:Uncharacterized protein n=1 Tax=Scortum barcoo TaxID=214431 RepID=A0ACB8WSE1_9TELE|nr:hypothetical protein L3Q82_025135 [Scortum barcoo]
MYSGYKKSLFKCQPHLPAQAIVHRELPKHQRDLIVQRYQSGEGYKRISKELNIPWNTVKTVIIKWRKQDVRPKLMIKRGEILVREAAKRPTATLKELQEFLASTGCVVHVTTIYFLQLELGPQGGGNYEQFQTYQSVLAQNLPTSVRKLKMKRNFIFQHDNDPKHTS